MKVIKSKEEIFHFTDNDLLRVYSFLANANQAFRISKFIKNLDYLDLFFYIYANNSILKKDVQFKDLSIYSSKSDVYLTKFLKDGRESGYLTYQISDKDRRIKKYEITEKAEAFLYKLNNFKKIS